LDGAGKAQILSLHVPVSTSDVVEAVDFGPRGGPVEEYDLEVRCGSAGCITLSIGGSGFADDMYEKVKGSRSHVIDMPWSNVPLITLMQVTETNRAILAVHGARVVVCLNGKCWSSGDSAVDVANPGDVTFSVIGDDFHNPAGVQINRLTVFHSA
jgi:hypothetical protein